MSRSSPMRDGSARCAATYVRTRATLWRSEGVRAKAKEGSITCTTLSSSPDESGCVLRLDVYCGSPPNKETYALRHLISCIRSDLSASAATAIDFLVSGVGSRLDLHACVTHVFFFSSYFVPPLVLLFLLLFFFFSLLSSVSRLRLQRIFFRYLYPSD